MSSLLCHPNILNAISQGSLENTEHYTYIWKERDNRNKELTYMIIESNKSQDLQLAS